MEGRHRERKQIIYYLNVYNVKTGSLLGHVSDITADGLSLIGEEEIKSGKIFHLRIELPREMRAEQDLVLFARCRWSRKDTDPSYFNSGFTLRKPSSNSLDIISQLISRYLYEEPEEDEEILPT